jgi:hypothetical protein
VPFADVPFDLLAEGMQICCRLPERSSARQGACAGRKGRGQLGWSGGAIAAHRADQQWRQSPDGRCCTALRSDRAGGI